MTPELTDFDLKAFKSTCKPLAQNNILRGPFELLGLVTAICSAPEFVDPSEWYSLVWRDDAEDPAFDSTEQAESIFSQLMGWSDYCAAAFAQEYDFELPAEATLDEAGRPTVALQDFAKGYLIGQEWLREVWDQYIVVDDSEESTLFTIAMILMLQCANPDSKQLAESEEIPDLLDMARRSDDQHSFISSSLAVVGQLGQDYYEQDFELETTPYVNDMKGVGRNDPCPCGSGKKYKKCCLN